MTTTTAATPVNGNGAPKNGAAAASSTTASGGNGRKPLVVYTIVEVNDDKSVWRRIGSAFINRDGSYNVFLDALPVNGKLHIREQTDQPVAGAQ